VDAGEEVLMPWWQALLDSLGTVVALVALCFIWLFGRRRWLSRRGSTFDCSVRLKAVARGRASTSTRGWTLGVGRYAGDNLEWFRVFSFSPRPRHVFSRSMHVVGRRTPKGAEAFALHAGHLVTEVALDGNHRIELAMSEPAFTGFLAWTEAALPGEMGSLPREHPPSQP
jgi:hypothetical protein